MKGYLRLLMFTLCMIMMFGFSNEVHAADVENQETTRPTITIHAGEGYYFHDDYIEGAPNTYTFNVNNKKIYVRLRNFIRNADYQVDGKYIVDWYTDSALTQKCILTYEYVRNHPQLDLYAKWGKCYGLNLEMGECYGLVDDSYRFLSGDTIKLRIKRDEYSYDHSDYDIDYFINNEWKTLRSVRRDGFVLVGLSKTPGGKLVDEVTFGEADETLYGVWKKGWNLRIDYNGGMYTSEYYLTRGVEQFTVLNGDKVSSVSSKEHFDDLLERCENDNYVCVGFSKNPNATVADITDILDLTINADTTVYMIWQDPDNITTEENQTEEQTNVQPGNQTEEQVNTQPGSQTEEQVNTQPGNQTEEQVNTQPGSQTEEQPNTQPETQTESQTNSQSNGQTEQNGQTNALETKNEIPTVGTVIDDTASGTNGKFKVKASNDGLTSVSYSSATNKKAKTISIPSTVKDENGVEYIVTEIEAKAFFGNKKVKKITVPETVTKISKNAFANCGKLGNITINANSLKSVGKNAFKGIKSGAKITVICENKDIYNKSVKMLKKAGAKNAKFKWKKG